MMDSVLGVLSFVFLGSLILDVHAQANSTSTPGDDGQNNSGPSPAALAGMLIGIFAFATIAVGTQLIFICNRRKESRKNAQAAELTPSPGSGSGDNQRYPPQEQSNVSGGPKAASVVTLQSLPSAYKKEGDEISLSILDAETLVDTPPLARRSSISSSFRSVADEEAARTPI